MKSEFFKLSKNRSLVYLFAITILFIFGISLMFYFSTIAIKFDRYNNLGENAERYVSRDELLELIEKYDERIKYLENNEGGIILGSEEQLVNDRNEALQIRNLYQYLYDNDIECDDVYISTGLNTNVDDVIAYQRTIAIAVFLLFLFIMAILASQIVTYEQEKGIKKFIYNSKNSRTSIVLKKYVMYLMVIAVFYAMYVLLSSIMSTAYNVNYKYVVCVLGDAGENIVGYSTYGMMALNYILDFWDILFWGTIIFAVSLFSENAFLNIVIDVAMIFSIFALINYTNSKFLACLVLPFSMYNSTNLSSTFYLIAQLIKLFIMVGVFIGSLEYFKRKDLV